MTTGNRRSAQQLARRAWAPMAGTGNPSDTPIGGSGMGSSAGAALAGGGPRSKAILERISKHLGHLSKAFDDLANTPIGGVPSGKGTARKK